MSPLGKRWVMAQKKAPKFRHWGNPKLAAAMRELRRSSAAQPHQDKRPDRGGSRQAAKRKAINDYK